MRLALLAALLALDGAVGFAPPGAPLRRAQPLKLSSRPLARTLGLRPVGGGRGERLFLSSVRAEGADFDAVPYFVLQEEGGPVGELPGEWDKAGVYAVYNKANEMQYVGMSRKVSVSISNHLIVVPGEECYSAKVVVWDKPTKTDLEGSAKELIEACIEASGGPPPGNTREVEMWRMKPSDLVRGKENVCFREGRKAEDALAEITHIVERHPVVLFMKGTRQFPQCGFSDATVAILNQVGVDYECVDCLDEDRNPGLRDGIKAFSDWPTIPQLYASGEFLGGAEIVQEMFEAGELTEVLKSAKPTFQQPTFTTIYPEEVQQVLTKDPEFVYVDVRTEGEYEAGHVPGAVLCPAFQDTANGRIPVKADFVAAIIKKYPDTNTKLVLGCQRGIRSKAAAEWLCEEGYTQLLEMEGGYALWTANPKLPVETPK